MNNIRIWAHLAPATLRGSAPCPSDLLPDDEEEGETDPDLAEYLDTAITALQTAQQLERDVRHGKVHEREAIATFTRIQKLLNVAREALDEAPL